MLREFRSPRLRPRPRPLAHRRQARRLASPPSCLSGPLRRSPLRRSPLGRSPRRSHRASLGRCCPGRHRLLPPRHHLRLPHRLQLPPWHRLPLPRRGPNPANGLAERHRLQLPRRGPNPANGLATRHRPRPQLGRTRQCCRNVPHRRSPVSPSRPNPSRPNPSRPNTGQPRIERPRRPPEPPRAVNPSATRPAKGPRSGRARPAPSVSCHSGRLAARSSQKTPPAGAG
jgi:hypothetical protein